MAKDYLKIGLILVVVLATVFISGCIGGDDTPNTTSNSEELINQAQVSIILTQFDDNGDDRISPEEFGGWAASVGLDQSDVDALTIIFNKFDSDGDKYLDKNELDALVSEYS